MEAAADMHEKRAQAIRGGVVGNGCCVNSVRERTARESLERERDEAIRRAAAIMNKIDALDKEYGKSMLEMPEQAFRQKFNLDIWGPF